jgi:hypothetical protein
VLVVDFVLAAFALVLVCTSHWRGAGGGVVTSGESSLKRNAVSLCREILLRIAVNPR